MAWNWCMVCTNCVHMGWHMNTPFSPHCHAWIGDSSSFGLSENLQSTKFGFIWITCSPWFHLQHLMACWDRVILELTEPRLQPALLHVPGVSCMFECDVNSKVWECSVENDKMCGWELNCNGDGLVCIHYECVYWFMEGSKKVYSQGLGIRYPKSRSKIACKIQHYRGCSRMTVTFLKKLGLQKWDHHQIALNVSFSEH